MLKIDRQNLWENEKKILEAIELGEELQIRKELLVEIGSIINYRYRNINTDFFEASQALICYFLSKWGSLGDKPIIKIKLSPYLSISIGIPMTEKQIEIYKTPVKENTINVSLPEKPKKTFPVSILIDLYDQLEELESILP